MANPLLNITEKDYSFIGALAYKNMEGACLYCDHCQPCPQQIEIGTVNKYLVLGKSGDTLAIGHYMKLEHHAEDCIACGVCEQRCPFHANVIERMQEAKTFFLKINTLYLSATCVNVLQISCIPENKHS